MVSGTLGPRLCVPVPFTPPQHPVNVNVIHEDGDRVQDHVRVLLLLELAPEEERLPEQDQEADVAGVGGHLGAAQLHRLD